MRITNLFWTVVLLAPLSVFAQQQKENLFTIDAQIRTRGEYRNGGRSREIHIPRMKAKKTANPANVAV